MNVLNGMVMAATIAERNGKSIIITKMIIAMEINRSRKNELTLSPTTFGWSAIRVITTSSGNSLFRYSSNTLSTSLP